MARQHTGLVLVEANGSEALQPVSLRPMQGASMYDEAWLQNIIFSNPGSIPIEEIAPSYGPLLPICRELDTRIAGPADALFINKLGMPTLIECKLWRNPQARREVIGQIIDYARVLRDWTYADLQREVARARKEQGFDLAKYVERQTTDPDFSEARFCDNLSRNLKRGHILLLIIGDGIREGVEAIANYVQETASLHFVLGLVEMTVYKLNESALILQPRILAKTTIIEREIFPAGPALLPAGDPAVLAVAEATIVSDSPHAPASNERQIWMRDFWSEFLATLKLDDQDQPLANALGQSNIFFSLPPNTDMWLTCFFEKSTSSIGVFLGSTKGSLKATPIAELLERDREDIRAEFQAAGVNVDIHRNADGKLVIIARQIFATLRDQSVRETQISWFQLTINAFVNVLRPRITEFLSRPG